ncbi:hypothetical protein RFI_20754 [Reticulomyxa filosa]|uniref:Uncharacterized protein n=1 Tax=Reticulomyxa filosa TaxID=46433 RepID=X6MRX8_RETFI|nr:hypothetical protein RFI_20754 [Reticulomyxa filosa]|eukprot:ETO16584.1 hypothetical protein RFI_20754 [Reticulomyxa filosa]
MLEQLQQAFPKIDNKNILQIWNWFNGNVDETKTVLALLTENTLQEIFVFFLKQNVTSSSSKTIGNIIEHSTTLEQQMFLWKLLKLFDGKVEKTIILQIWKNSNQFYYETLLTLQDICFNHSLKEQKEDSELRIIREMCSNILWNILNNPKQIKYRQISHKNLYNTLLSKCKKLGGNVDQIHEYMEYHIQQFGFKKRNDSNWYYSNDNIQLLSLWRYYKAVINEQIIKTTHNVCFLNKNDRYKTRYGIPERVCMLSNGKWRDYESVFDYEHRTIMLFNQNKLKIKSLQVGNPKRPSLEFNVHIQWYNDLNDVNNTHAKWACLILNHTWHFRTMDQFDRSELSNCCSEFNTFHVLWKDGIKTHKESLNPYLITLEQGIERVKDKLQMRDHFIFGKDELILFECEFDKWNPPIISNMIEENVLLHDIYKHLHHYPIIQVYWEITYRFMLPYKRTIDINRTNLPKNRDICVEFYPLMEKPTFNPFLYECDVHKLQFIQDMLQFKVQGNHSLQRLLHEVIENGYLCDLITYQYAKNKKEEKKFHANIKQQINYDKNDEEGKLLLNDKILTILNELKILYHDDIHKHMGYPLQLHHICAILLYCGKSCNSEFSYDQIQFRHYKWPYLDSYLQDAIFILHAHERREESEMELYCGLKKVRLENIKKRIKEGNFISYVSTSDDLQVAKMFRSDQGCILHFHPSMRRGLNIYSCDVSWISPFKHEREILFSRSGVNFIHDEKTHKKYASWNAKVESEDEYTQMILLKWTKYDEYIQQIIQISTIWNYSIDLNLIYVVLDYWNEGDMNETIELLLDFEKWKVKDNNEQKYKEKINEFVERRCCNHNINLFSIFFFEKYKGRKAIEHATINTVNNGLPFVKSDKETWIKVKIA